MGASCAGSTTLGKALADELGCVYFDTDEYFWMPSAIPYTIKRDTAERNAMLKNDFLKEESVIVSGSLASWGEEWLTAFDLVVFLYVPHQIRMHRLHKREVERYGDAIFTDPLRIKLYKDFTNWATGYDDNSTNGRNLGVHLNWLSKLNCTVLKIEGDTTVAERLSLTVAKIKDISLQTCEGRGLSVRKGTRTDRTDGRTGCLCGVRPSERCPQLSRTDTLSNIDFFN